MAGDRQRFQSLMKAGEEALWDENWERAVEAFMGAVREFPEYGEACNNLGLALFQVGRMEDALKAYAQAHRLDPDDPVPVERSAEVLEHLNRTSDAAKQRLIVAEIYLGKHDIEKAIENWHAATDLTPGLIKIHQRLAQAYERTGQKVEAMNQYLKLAYNFQKAGNQQVALQALERALRINPREPTILNAITAVRNKNPLSPDIAVKGKGDEQVDDDMMARLLGEKSIGEADDRGPIGEAVELALEQVATYVFESGRMDEAGAAAMKGVEMHRAGILEEATKAYQQAGDAGIRHPGLFLNLGVLLLEKHEWDEAIRFLQAVSQDQVLEAGAAHGLALAYMGQRNWREAAKNLLNALRLVDMSMAMGDEEAAILMSTYSSLNSLLDQEVDETLHGLSEKYTELLTGSDWKRRVTQTRKQMENLLKEGSSLSDFAEDEGVIESMSVIDMYLDQRKYALAMNEAFYIIEKSPDYLAAHQRVGDILMEQGQIVRAIEKYNVLVQTYLAREEDDKATEVLNSALEIAPGDVSLRSSLIKMLESQERWPDAIIQYVELGGAYRDLADTSNARTAYERASELAQQFNAPQEQTVGIMLGMARLDMDRMDTRSAMDALLNITQIDPENVEARSTLVDLNFRIGNPVQATQELDRLLQIYAKQRRPDLIVDVLETQARRNPDDMGLRSRLGGVYAQMKRLEDSVKHFDKLAELQIDSGHSDEARKTLQRIISMNPPNAAEYQQLLQQLGG